MALKQVYNSRSKKWVLLDDEKRGGIKKMQPEKFEGVPVKGEESEEEKTEQVQKNELENIPDKKSSGFMSWLID